MYWGNTSDRHITEKEFGQKIDPRDAVMVDRSFNIADLAYYLKERQSRIFLLSLYRKRSGSEHMILNQKEITKTKEVASLRIHVERAIERLKNYIILSQALDISLWPLLDQLLVVIAVMCNMEPPLLSE